MTDAAFVRSHLHRVLGHGKRKYQPMDYSTVGDVEVLFVFDDELQAMHVATVGLSELPITALQPTEFVCSVHTPQIEAARFLVETAVDMAVNRGAQITLDSSMTNATPLLADTDIHGVLLSPGLWYPELDIVEDAAGDIVLHMMTLLPLTGTDVAMLDAHGADALYERIESTEADVLDITRAVPI